MARLNYKEVLKGDSGTVFYPHVTDDSILYWTNEDGLQNPKPVSIKGKDGNILQKEEIEKINKSLSGFNISIDNLIRNKMDIDYLITMNNLSDDVKKSITGDSVAIVGDNCISNTNIKDGQVYGYKTDFIEVNRNFNMIDKRNIKINKLIDGGTNGEEKEQEGFFCTDFIRVYEGENYYYNGLYQGYYAFYDINKNYIEGIGVVNDENQLNNPFNIPIGAKYIRMTGNKLINKDNCYISIKNENNDMVYLLKDINLSNNTLTEIKKVIEKNLTIDVNNVKFLNEYGFVNPINKELIKENTYIMGAIDGSEKKASGLYATDYCKIEPNTNYYYHDIYQGHYAFYDESKNFISGGGIAPSETDLNNPFKTPINAKYVRFTIDKKAKIESCWINKENKEPSNEKEYVLTSNIYTSKEIEEMEKDKINPTEYEGWEISIFNKIICIGDSLTEGTFNDIENTYPTYKKYSYPTYLTKLTGVETTNLGKGGYTSKRWWDEMQNQSFTGHDCAIIQLGVNDVAIASQNITAELTKQYLQNIIDKLKNENEGIKIFVAGITKSKWYSNSNYQARNDTIKNFASNRESENIYFIDLMEYSKNYDKPFANGHLTAIGYLQQAKEYKNYISYLIHKNINNFEDVQFIGTNKRPMRGDL